MASTVRLNAIISIHALLAEGDRLLADVCQRGPIISIHALLAEGDGDVKLIVDLENISIHALLAEGDLVVTGPATRIMNFYPRPPCGARPAPLDFDATELSQFLSTPSLRRATLPGPPWRWKFHRISIHALLAEGDLWCICWTSTTSYFYPRPPCGGRPPDTSARDPVHDFYPRPPCGGRHNVLASIASSIYFYPRPPCGGRRGTIVVAHVWQDFYPRPPCGGRLQIPTISISTQRFLSTPSLRRATVVVFVVPS